MFDELEINILMNLTPGHGPAALPLHRQLLAQHVPDRPPVRRQELRRDVQARAARRLPLRRARLLGRPGGPGARDHARHGPLLRHSFQGRFLLLFFNFNKPKRLVSYL